MVEALTRHTNPPKRQLVALVGARPLLFGVASTQPHPYCHNGLKHPHHDWTHTPPHTQNTKTIIPPNANHTPNSKPRTISHRTMCSGFNSYTQEGGGCLPWGSGWEIRPSPPHPDREASGDWGLGTFPCLVPIFQPTPTQHYPIWGGGSLWEDGLWVHGNLAGAHNGLTCLCFVAGCAMTAASRWHCVL